MVARMDLDRLAASLSAELAEVNDYQLADRIRWLDHITTSARDLIRKANRERLELNRELIRIELVEAVRSRFAKGVNGPEK